MTCFSAYSKQIFLEETNLSCYYYFLEENFAQRNSNEDVSFKNSTVRYEFDL
jgi:hypothetical protein